MSPQDRARLMLGVPFLHLGRSAKGTDCIGLAAYAYSYPARKLPSDYPRDPLNGELEKEIRAALGPPVLEFQRGGAEARFLRPDDLVLMAYRDPIRHVGIVGSHPAFPGHLSLIHTDSTVGKVVEHILDFKWLRRIREVYRP